MAAVLLEVDPLLGFLLLLPMVVVEAEVDAVAIFLDIVVRVLPTTYYVVALRVEEIDR